MMRACLFCFVSRACLFLSWGVRFFWGGDDLGAVFLGVSVLLGEFLVYCCM